MRTHRRLLVSAFASFLAIPLHATITGTVVNGDGAAVGGAKVTLFAPETLDARRVRYQSKTLEKTPLGTTTSDSRGNFKFETPKEPVVDVKVEAKGFAPEAVRALADDELGVIALTAAPTVKGTITAGGKPVAGAVVVLIGGAEYAAITDADGKYSAPDPTKWANRLMIIHPDYAYIDEFLTPDLNKKGLDRGLTAGVAISGKVVGADGSTPASNALIFVDNWQLAAAGADGSFKVAHAMKDWAQVEARIEDRNGARAHAASASSVTIKLAKSASVAGMVIDAKSQLPLAGATVQLAPGPALGPAAISSRVAFTDAKGRYMLTPVTPGTYSLTVNRPGATMPNIGVSVKAGEAVQKALYMSAMGRVTGSVVDDDKQAVAGARVSARSANRDPNMTMIGNFRGGGPVAVSAPDGRYVLRSVETDSDLRIGAAKKGYPAGTSATLRVAPAERKSGVTIVIPRGIALNGKVTDSQGKPLSGVAVDAAESANDFGGGNVRRMVMAARGDRSGDDMVRSGSDGSFNIRLKEGTYDVVFKREGFSTKTARGIQVNSAAKPLEVALEPGVEIIGRVVRSGQGVEDVNVAVISTDGFTNTTTAPDGSFRLSDLTAGQMMLTVNKREAFVQINRPITAPAKDVLIELPAGGRIAGRVVEKSSKKPVISFDAGITTSRSGGGMMFMMPPMMRHFTSDDGSFVLENVPPGPTNVVVSAPGYTTSRQTSVNVEDGKSAPDLEVLMETGVKLTGRVTGPDGAAISGASVRLDEAGGGAGRVMRFNSGPDQGTTTDPNGEYSLDAMEAGERTFTFNRQGYLAESRTITLSGDRARLDVTLSTGTRVSGFVSTDAGSPVADAQVSAVSASDPGFGKSVRADANGAFQFEGLASGHYTFSASKSGYATGTVRDFDVTVGAPLRIVMKSGGVIMGHVTGLTDKELSEATVMANSQNGNASSSIDAKGNYRIDGAPSGTVRVTARVGGMGMNFKSSVAKTVELESGGSSQVDIEFKSNTVIRGRVTRNGQPLTGAMVAFATRAGRGSGGASGTTDGSGAYEINGLDDGSYNVQVLDIQRLSPYQTTYDVRGSSTFDIDIKSASVRVHVLNQATGEPLAEARVELRPPGTEGMMGSRVAQTDAAGTFTLDNVARGTYEGVASAQGFGHATKSVVVGDTLEEVEFRLAPSSGIRLTVVDARDKRPLSASARVTDMSGREIQPMAGRGAFGGGSAEPIQLDVAPGSYRVTVSAFGYAPNTMTLNSPSQPVIQLSPGGTLVINAKNGSVRIRIVDGNGQPYLRGPFAPPAFTFERQVTLQNIAAGHYRIERLNEADQSAGFVDVDVVEGQTATAAI